MNYYLSASLRPGYAASATLEFIQVIGKDILLFHSYYWPALLLALGIPFRISLVVTGWLLQGDEKISKSKGNYGAISELGPPEVLRAHMISLKLGLDHPISPKAVAASWELLRKKVANCAHRVFK